MLLVGVVIRISDSSKKNEDDSNWVVILKLKTGLDDTDQSDSIDCEDSETGRLLATCSEEVGAMIELPVKLSLCENVNPDITETDEDKGKNIVSFTNWVSISVETGMKELSSVVSNTEESLDIGAVEYAVLLAIESWCVISVAVDTERLTESESVFWGTSVTFVSITVGVVMEE